MSSFSNKYNLITILGPTASGKTSLAAHLCLAIDGEIISADSRQVYRKMDLGTGKDLDDYVINGKPVKFHLIDIAEPGYKFNVFEFQNHFVEAFTTIHSYKKIPVLCGGSGLYIEAAIKGYQLISVPENGSLRNELEKKPFDELVYILRSYRPLHNQTDTCNLKRLIRAIEIEEYISRNGTDYSHFPVIRNINFGVRYPRQQERDRITERLKSRLKQGLIDEVKGLLDSGIAVTDLLYYGLEYKWITLYLIDQIDYNTMFGKLNTAIHQFAKRQMTWFRRMERNGEKIYWIDGNLPMEAKIELILATLNG